MYPMCVCAGQKRALDFLELELLEVVNYPTCVLGVSCGSLEEQDVLWTAEPSLQPLSKILKQECVCVLLDLLNLKCSKK